MSVSHAAQFSMIEICEVREVREVCEVAAESDWWMLDVNAPTT
jgi:hypothetical protein